jgi:hypothetical protein
LSLLRYSSSTYINFRLVNFFYFGFSPHLTSAFPFTDSESVSSINVYSSMNTAKSWHCSFPLFYTNCCDRSSPCNKQYRLQNLPTYRLGNLTYWQVVLYPCLPELIWHRHLRPRSVSGPPRIPSTTPCGCKGENMCSHVTGWSPWRDNVKRDSLRESRRISHRDRTKWARAFRRRKVIHTLHLSEFNVKGAALITAKIVFSLGPFRKA